MGFPNVSLKSFCFSDNLERSRWKKKQSSFWFCVIRLLPEWMKIPNMFAFFLCVFWKLKGKKKVNNSIFLLLHSSHLLCRKTQFSGYWRCKINKISFYIAEGINFVILRYETLGSVGKSGTMGSLQAWQRDIHCLPNHTFISSDLQ